MLYASNQVCPIDHAHITLVRVADVARCELLGAGDFAGLYELQYYGPFHD